MTYAGLGMLMSNVISLHCERCGVGNARSLNALSYRNARSEPHTGSRHYAAVPSGKASLNDKGEIVDPILWLLYIRYTAELGYLPFLPCGWGPFSAAKPSRPALSKHKSIVRPLNFQ